MPLSDQMAAISGREYFGIISKYPFRGGEKTSTIRLSSRTVIAWGTPLGAR